MRSLKTGMDKSFNIVLLDVSKKPRIITRQGMPTSDCQIHLSFTGSGYQLQKHLTNDGIGRYMFLPSVDLLFLDQKNFQRYNEGKACTCYKYYTNINGALNGIFNISDEDADSYLILRNHQRSTHVIINYSVNVTVQTTSDHVQIVTPIPHFLRSPFSTLAIRFYSQVLRRQIWSTSPLIMIQLRLNVLW